MKEEKKEKKLGKKKKNPQQVAIEEVEEWGEYDKNAMNKIVKN